MTENKHEALVRENQRQVEEALGPVNRYYANRHFGREATGRELIWYYIEHGGASGFRERIKHDPPPPEVMETPS